MNARNVFFPGLSALMVLFFSSTAWPDFMIYRIPRTIVQLNATPGTNKSPDLARIRAEEFQGFRIVWQNHTDSKIYHNRVNRYGQAGEEEVVEESNAYGGSAPSIGSLPQGDFVISWAQYVDEESSHRILGKRFHPTGIPYGDPMVLEYHADLGYVGDYYAVEGNEVELVDSPDLEDHVLILGWNLVASTDRDNAFGRIITFPESEWGTILSSAFLGADPDEPGHLDDSDLTGYPRITDTTPSVARRSSGGACAMAWVRTEGSTNEVRFSTFTLPGGALLFNNEVAYSSSEAIDRDVAISPGGSENLIVQWASSDNIFVQAFGWENCDPALSQPGIINSTPVDGLWSGYWGTEVAHVSNDGLVSNYVSVWNDLNSETGYLEIFARPFWIDYETIPPSLTLGLQRKLVSAGDKHCAFPRIVAGGDLSMVFAAGDGDDGLWDIYFGSWRIVYPRTPN